MNAAEHLLGAAALARHGSRVALICGDEELSYSELAARAARAAGALATLGVRPGERVLMLMRDTPEFAAAWLGALRAGAVAVALNTKLSEAEYRHVLADCAPRLAIVEDRLAAARPDLSAELAADGRLAVSGAAPAGLRSWAGLQQHARVAGAFDAAPDSPAFWLYSSGTTGRPKGIVHAHRSVLPAGRAMHEFGIAAGERVFTTSKFFFAYGLEHGLVGALALGASSIVCADWLDPEQALALVSRHRPVAFFSVPSFYRRLLALQAPRLEPFRGVRRFVAAGERLPLQLVEHWKSAVGGEILSLYGMSETFCACMITPPGTSNGVRTGRPIQDVETRLVTAEAHEPAPGEPGVLWIRHPALATGYANLPERTREQFRDGWFCTGDLFVRDAEGFFVHQGRSDEMVKVAGQWVQPGELEEAALAETSVAEAACVPVPDQDGLERLALFVAARGDEGEAARAAAEACERSLPRHKRPKWVRAVAELPRTATGKVQRYKLREILERELSRKT
jgi:benzoate-CoA ligase